MGYMIGVDGGATGTVAILTETDGTVLQTAKAKASNYIAVGKDDAKAALHAVIHEVVEKAGKSLQDCTVAVFGLAGLNSDHDAEVYRSLIEPIGLGGELYIENDIVIAWAAATNCDPGVVVIAGTGSSAFGVNAEGQRVKTLGWDYILADQGSGYWIGLEGVRTAIKSWDGRIPPTPLLEAMVRHYKLEKAEEMLTYAHSPAFDKTNIASFAKEVSRCANEENDIAAQTILSRAGDELGQAVVAVIQRLGIAEDTFTVGMVGGAFRSGEYLTKPFEEKILATAPNANIQFARYPSVIGAVIYAHYKHGTLNNQLLQTLENSAGDLLRWKS